MKNDTEITPEMLRAKIREARKTLDQLRQLDNLILFGMNNPPELDPIRQRILDSMQRLTGAIQESENALDRHGDR